MYIVQNYNIKNVYLTGIKETPAIAEKVDNINVNIHLISNDYPEILSNDEVLDIFVQYIHKYRNHYRKFDIPVGTKYLEYSDYIHQKLKWAFPDINWKIRICSKFYLCTGEYTV